MRLHVKCTRVIVLTLVLRPTGPSKQQYCFEVQIWVQPNLVEHRSPRFSDPSPKALNNNARIERALLLLGD